MPAVQERLVTAETVGEALQVRPSTVLSLARQGLIPSVRISPKLIRFDLAAVLDTLGRIADSVAAQ